MNQNPQALFFSNNKIRPLADMYYSLYLTAIAILEQWNSQNMPKVIPMDNEIIDDGAGKDGRPLITDQQINDFISVLQDLVKYHQDNNNIGKISSIQVNATGKA